jgi:hypothetical protein
MKSTAFLTTMRRPITRTSCSVMALKSSWRVHRAINLKMLYHKGRLHTMIVRPTVGSTIKSVYRLYTIEIAIPDHFSNSVIGIKVSSDDSGNLGTSGLGKRPRFAIPNIHCDRRSNRSHHTGWPSNQSLKT